MHLVHLVVSKSYPEEFAEIGDVRRRGESLRCIYIKIWRKLHIHKLGKIASSFIILTIYKEMTLIMKTSTATDLIGIRYL